MRPEDACPWDPSKGLCFSVPTRHVFEGRVAAEELVPAQSGERDLDAGFVRGSGDQEGVEAVDRGLVHRGERGLPGGRDVGAGEAALEVAGAEGLGDPSRERRFVAVAPLPAFEGQREGRELVAEAFSRRARRPAPSRGRPRGRGRPGRRRPGGLRRSPRGLRRRSESSPAAGAIVGAGRGSPTTPSRTVSRCPAGSARIDLRIVQGSGTLPQSRKPTRPAGSTSIEAPPASSARTCEANRKACLSPFSPFS